MPKRGDERPDAMPTMHPQTTPPAPRTTRLKLTRTPRLPATWPPPSHTPRLPIRNQGPILDVSPSDCAGLRHQPLRRDGDNSKDRRPRGIPSLGAIFLCLPVLRDCSKFSFSAFGLPDFLTYSPTALNARRCYN